MEIYLKHIIPNFILMTAIIYGWHKLLDRRVNFKDPKLYITIVGLMIISILNYVVTQTFIRVVLLTIIFMFFIKFLFKESIQRTIITAVFHQFIIFISESIYAVLISLTFGTDFAKILNSIHGLILTNFVIAILSILFTTNKYIKKIYLWILNVTKKIKNGQLIPLALIILIVLNIFNAAVYYKIKFGHLLIVNSLLIFLSTVIVIYTLRTQNNLNKVSDKYNVVIKSLNDYEDMMSKYRVANHENQNLLLTVRAMILNNEKDIPKYIDTIIEDKYKDDEKLLFKMAVIPTGGLRATIYSSIMKIIDNNIKYDLIIDKKIKTSDLIELDTNTTIDVCKIIGVFVDNAIDETMKLKNKNIVINLYVENNNFYIKISNSIKGNINLDKIYDEGYTTKTKGHGYGLCLVKNIINNNALLENNIELNSKIFSQVLIIKNKK